MKPTLRSLFFWPHLISGVVAGSVIGLMCLTGAAVAFEDELLEWADRHASRAERFDPAQPPQSIDQLVARARAEQPKAELSGVTLYADPSAALRLQFGRDGAAFANPYTGQVVPAQSEGLHAFLHALIDWHRWLGREGEQRALGKAITGACNLAFGVLALTGLYLWWPRSWRWTALRGTAWFRRGLRGKARDFNWHNVTGFWTLPVLLVLIASGVVLSYRWAGELLFRAAGEPPPPPQQRGPPAAVPPPSPGASPLSLDALAAVAKARFPRWESVSLRLGKRDAPAAAVSLTVREPQAWPRFATAQLTLDPFTGAVLEEESYATASPARKVRSWLRFLHTGEAFGLLGKALAAIASLGGALLVWTGLALSLRRFAAWRRRRSPSAHPERSEAAASWADQSRQET